MPAATTSQLSPVPRAKRTITMLIAGALVVAGVGVAHAADPKTGFDSSPTGCPTFWEVDGRPQGGDINPPVGPLGTAQLHVTGFGFDVQGEDFTVTIRVVDMQRRVAPGTNKSLWIASFGEPQAPALLFVAEYDLISNSFAFYWNRPFSGNPNSAARGNVALGPGGGVSITTTLAELGVGSHFIAEETRATGSALGTFGGAFYGVPWSNARGPDSVPLVPCPGVALSAQPRVTQGVIAGGFTLPKAGGQSIELQLLEGTEWTTVAEGTTDNDGGFGMTATVPRGTVTLRGVVTTPAGIGTSAPLELQIP